MKKTILLLIYLTFFNLFIYSQDVSTLAGNTNGYFNGSTTAAKFNRPVGVCLDDIGNLYVADSYNNAIRKIDVSLGTVTTLAGSTMSGYADGTGTAAKFYSPNDVCYDGNGNLYIADYLNNAIRKIEITTGNVTTFAGNPPNFGSNNGIGIAAMFNGPSGICYDGNGNLYVADCLNHVIRKIEIATAEVTTFAGSSSGFSDGIGALAAFKRPYGICYDGRGNLFVTDSWNYKIRKIKIASAEVSTLAGSTQGYNDGTGNTARFRTLGGLSSDGGDNIFVLDVNMIRKVIISTGEVSTFSGSSPGLLDGSISTALFSGPLGITKDDNGNLFIGDSNNHRIRKIAGAYSLGVKQVDAHKMSIYPNPAQDYLNIGLPNNSALKQIELYNSLGHVVSNEIELTKDNTINVSQLSNGMYLLKLTTTEGVSQTIKFIKD